MSVFAPLICFAFLVPGLLAVVAYVLGARCALMQDALTPFECGFDPKNSARSPFSLRFFLLAVIFLIFDVEVALLLPSPLFISLSSRFIVLSTLGVFLVILVVGLFHE